MMYGKEYIEENLKKKRKKKSDLPTLPSQTYVTGTTHIFFWPKLNFAQNMLLTFNPVVHHQHVADALANPCLRLEEY